MVQRIVIDKDILGSLDEKDLLRSYEKIYKVGDDPDLPQRSSDEEIASYCKNNNCDLLTGDKTAYTKYLRTGIKKVQISEYTWLSRQKGDKPVYLIEIVD